MEYQRNFDRRPLGTVLRGRQMRGVVLAAARLGAAHAAAIAPKESGAWSRSFRAAAGLGGRDRVIGRVYSTDPAAVAKEFGTSDTPGHHTLAKTAKWLPRGVKGKG